MNEAAFGNRLREVRKEKKLSTNKLSESCGITAVFLRQIESSARLPSLPVFVSFCNELQVSPHHLLLDSLDPAEEDRVNSLLQKMRSLSPKQLDIVVSMMDTLMDKMDE